MDMPATPNSGLNAGMLVGGGRYQLQRMLGQGGMGEVWLALDSRLREQVALKFLPPKIRADAHALEDMRRETLKSHRLSHPNIIRIHDLFESPDETPFISMEYISGQNLHHLLADQPQGVFVWDYLRPLIQQLCEALQYAHDEGVIHRDLKPANMMLDAKGRLKLADFGIAALVTDPAQRDAIHQISGTLTHMSPQQMQGKPPCVTDDIYALGATLYELLSSKPPFYKGDILGQVLDHPTTPLRDRLWELAIENPIPDDVVSLIMACLAKDPAQRPQSAADIAQWLGLPKRGASSATQTITPPTPEPEAPAAPRRRPLPVLVGLLVLGAVGFAAWQGWEKFLRPANLQMAWTEPARWRVVQESALPDASWSLPWVMPDGSNLRAASFNSEAGGTEAVPLLRSNLRWLTHPDGQTWQPGQKAFPHGIIRWNYESEFVTSHAVGQRDGDGWIARGGRGHMVYGPYRKFPGGDYRAFFR
ncbi:MAG: serine/threonine protein kinase with repeat, partial [Verrucomicrobia bacterium]|nr:serine/threonine protein kinase with repeat [Verrucomicrobiota bacterium]